MEVVIKRALFSLLAALLVGPVLFYQTTEAVSVKIADNGLSVIAKRSPSDGIIAVHVSVRAGSSLEADKVGSGIAHLVEHMVFKGTASRGPGAVEKETKSYGAFLGGSVDADHANFYITLPKDHLEPCLGLIKDILSNALFDQSEIDREKEVVLKEINLVEDDPQKKLVRSLDELAYLDHPYRHPVIGYEDALRSLTREDLLEFYRNSYVPAKMVIALAGDIDESQAIGAVIDEFGDFGRNNRNIPALRQEKKQLNKRSLSVDMPIELAYTGIAFPSTGLEDKDLYATDVLAMVLGRGDGSRLNSELYKKSGLVHSITAYNHTPEDPGLFTIIAVSDADKSGSIEDAVTVEIEKLKSGGITDDELQTAKRMALSDYLFSMQTLEEQADMLATGYMATGSPDFAMEYVEGIKSVTKEQVLRAAKKYLDRNASSTVRVMSTKNVSGAPAAGQPVIAEAGIHKELAANGARALIRKDARTPTVAITAAMLAGLSAESSSDNGISNIVSRMLLKGTKTRSEDDIRGAIEKLGGNITPFSGFNGMGVTIEVLKDDLPVAIEVLSDILSDSVFPESELAKEKELALASIKQEDDDIFTRADNNLRQLLFAGSPYALRQSGEPLTVESITRQSAMSFYEKYCVADNLVISISGDVDTARTAELIKRKFGGLKKTGGPLDVSENTGSIDDVKTRSIGLDRRESIVMMGFRTPASSDPDRYAADVLASVLSGHSGRLFEKLRGQAALAYTLGCVNRPMKNAGYMLLYIATTKEKMSEAEKELIGQVNLVRKANVSDQELESAKNELLLNHAVRLQSNAAFSTQTALDELYGLGCDNVYKYQAQVGSVTADDVKRCAVKYLDPSVYAEVTIVQQQKKDMKR